MISLRARRHICLWAALLISLPVFGQSEDPFLATLPIQRAEASGTAPLAATIRLSAHVDRAQSTASMLSKIDGVKVLRVNDGMVELAATARPTAKAGVDERFLMNSFVIDYEQPSMQAMLAQFRDRYGASASTGDMQAFVYERISNKTYMRSFDFASTVASSGAGDCTEHAVLLAALARAEGIPSRVVFGTLILERDTELAAYGHAWTELHSDSGWEIADATLEAAATNRPRVRYLPLAVFENEGPGYTFSLFEIMSSMPAKITGVVNLDDF